MRISRSNALHWLLLTWTVALIGVLIALSDQAAHAQPPTYWLTVFHNNDGESNLLPDDAAGGAARFIAKLNELRAAVDPSHGQLMLSSGDNFLAGPAFNAGLQNGVPFYDTMLMDMIGYDAVCLGNHDFDFGPDVLADFLAGYTTPVPYLSANLDFSGELALQAYVDAGILLGSTVVTAGGEQIGIVGATTEALPYISSPRNVVVNAVAPAIQNQVDMLLGMGIDKIILISHLQTVLEDLALAPQLIGVDVMIAGGGDDLLANAGDLLIPGDEGLVAGPYPLMATSGDGSSVPVITTSGQYRYIGKLEVGFDAAGNVVTIGDGSGPVRVVTEAFLDGVAPDPVAQSTVLDPLQVDLDELANTVVATSDVALDGRRSFVRTAETNEGNLCADALLWNARRLAAGYGLPMADVALQNGGGIRNNEIVPAGPISALKTLQILPFANFACAVPHVPREQFKEILENCVSRVEFTDGRFGQIGGCRFLWNPNGTPQVIDASGNVTTPGSRIVEAVLDNDEILVQGGNVVPGPALTVATIDFLANGGDQYPFRGLPFTRIGLTYERSLTLYLSDGLGGVITAQDYPEGGERRIITEGTVRIDNDDDDPAPEPENLPAVVTLGKNYPNPFNPMTTIAFSLPRADHVRLAVFDLAGHLVRTLVDEGRAAGTHTVVWEGLNNAGYPVASGMYFYRMEAGSRSMARGMVMLK